MARPPDSIRTTLFLRQRRPRLRLNPALANAAAIVATALLVDSTAAHAQSASPPSKRAYLDAAMRGDGDATRGAALFAGVALGVADPPHPATATAISTGALMVHVERHTWAAYRRGVVSWTASRMPAP